ncbi:MAG TPA: patatin-like phospholipase family protein [Anaerolineales bacterium]|nr:patatin-like phospholipase family protein [Anaerolineales bacterium]
MATQHVRALILSGGGGRGAFHAGVYKYLMERNKGNVDADHTGAWEPEIVVGTSIGAVNGAAIAQGMPADQLVEVWKSLEEHDIQGLPPGMRGIARWAARAIFQEVMDARLPQIPPEEATSPIPREFWPPLPLLPRWLASRLIGYWINLLDTGPLRKTLFTRFELDEEKLARSEKALLIAATKVRTGERVLFSNRDVKDQKRGKLRQDVFTGITADRILASCSIPLVYPWTFDPGTEAFYWDGALVANTPLGAAIDMMGSDASVPAEVVVVMMTPWWETGDPAPVKAEAEPKSFGDAITWMLDWMLLASFRENLKMIRAFNELALREREGETPSYRYRIVTPLIVSPLEFLRAERIIDYDGDVSAHLIDEGYKAAKYTFEKAFPASNP